ncbi:MAG TPA: prepilin-type N-terminal cleavage/methylation domain-containing protein [Gemmatimonadaceae bacterium]|nr:prepilin-type N-terminal cleavage/methylation domain-containing protein [Gemmatimonadaceae bacterium]
MSAREHRGFSLVEILVSFTVLAVVGGGLAAAVASQWRSHDGLADDQRIRQAMGGTADLLLAEIRSVSPAAGDIRAALDTALEVRATLGTAVVCSVTVARDRIMVPPRRPVAGAPLTWWRDMPAPGDSIDIFNARGGLPDSISRHELVALGGGRCPMASPFARSAADATSSLELTVSPPLPPSIGTGAPVRFLRWTRYSLYRSTADNRWYFGIKELLSGAWAVVQPVTGPLAPAAPLGSGGMSLRVIDSAGSTVTTGAYGGARAIELSVRARGLRGPRALGRRVQAAESLHVVLAPRNE